jgi:hypothetical protein
MYSRATRPVLVGVTALAIGLALVASVSAAFTPARRISGHVRLGLRIAQPESGGGNTTVGGGGVGSGPVLRKATGTFSVSGAVRDAGSFALASSAGPPTSPTLIYQLTGKHGALRLAVSGAAFGGRQVGGGGGSSSSTTQKGHWHIVSGRGAYARLHGSGKAAEASQQSVIMVGVVRSD